MHFTIAHRRIRFRWFVTVLLAGAAILGINAQADEREGESLRISQDQTTLSIVAGERTILEYRITESPRKPYVSALRSPSGVQILRDAPPGHMHHHALMFAIAADGVNFWEEASQSGNEKHRTLRLLAAAPHEDPEQAGFVQGLEWVGPSDATVLTEERTVRVCLARDLTATLLSWRSRLSLPPGKEACQLSGSHYFGLGMRFLESMDRGGRFTNSDGKEGEWVRGSEYLIAAKWCAYTATADGSPVTVALFDHANNPRHPARMFTMTTPFAYLAATLNLWKEPLTLKAGSPLELNYGLALWDGQVEPEKIERAYQKWTGFVAAAAGH